MAKPKTAAPVSALPPIAISDLEPLNVADLEPVPHEPSVREIAAARLPGMRAAEADAKRAVNLPSRELMVGLSALSPGVGVVNALATGDWSIPGAQLRGAWNGIRGMVTPTFDGREAAPTSARVLDTILPNGSALLMNPANPISAVEGGVRMAGGLLDAVRRAGAPGRAYFSGNRPPTEAENLNALEASAELATQAVAPMVAGPVIGAAGKAVRGARTRLGVTKPSNMMNTMLTEGAPREIIESLDRSMDRTNYTPQDPRIPGQSDVGLRVLDEIGVVSDPSSGAARTRTRLNEIHQNVQQQLQNFSDVQIPSQEVLAAIRDPIAQRLRDATDRVSTANPQALTEMLDAHLNRMMRETGGRTDPATINQYKAGLYELLNSSDFKKAIGADPSLHGIIREQANGLMRLVNRYTVDPQLGVSPVAELNRAYSDLRPGLDAWEGLMLRDKTRRTSSNVIAPGGLTPEGVASTELRRGVFSGLSRMWNSPRRVTGTARALRTLAPEVPQQSPASLPAFLEPPIAPTTPESLLPLVPDQSMLPGGPAQLLLPPVTEAPNAFRVSSEGLRQVGTRLGQFPGQDTLVFAPESPASTVRPSIDFNAPRSQLLLPPPTEAPSGMRTSTEGYRRVGTRLGQFPELDSAVFAPELPQSRSQALAAEHADLIQKRDAIISAEAQAGVDGRNHNQRLQDIAAQRNQPAFSGPPPELPELPLPRRVSARPALPQNLPTPAESLGDRPKAAITPKSMGASSPTTESVAAQPAQIDYSTMSMPQLRAELQKAEQMRNTYVRMSAGSAALRQVDARISTIKTTLQNQVDGGYDDKQPRRPDSDQVKTRDEFQFVNPKTLKHENEDLVTSTPIWKLFPDRFKTAKSVRGASPIDGEWSTHATWGQNLEWMDIANRPQSAKTGPFAHSGWPFVGWHNQDKYGPEYDNFNQRNRVLNRSNNTIVTRGDKSNNPFVLLHEYGHSIHEVDLTDAERAEWRSIYSQRKNKYDELERKQREARFEKFQKRINDTPAGEDRSALIREQSQQEKRDETELTKLKVLRAIVSRRPEEAFPSLIAHYVLDPSALKTFDPGAYKFVKKLFGGREFIRSKPKSSTPAPTPAKKNKPERISALRRGQRIEGVISRAFETRNGRAIVLRADDGSERLVFESEVT